MSTLIRRVRRAFTPSPSPIRPGWYRVPGENRERWHDDHGWSDHYRPTEGVTRL